MSFLAPLYALGALAVALPILFHLIQRRPRGEQVFSSLMFLSPSPPRLTRRSRLDNLLLLLLRALALILMAVAFARPFVRSYLQQLSDLPAQRVVLLVDTSASMRRADLWSRAITEATTIAADLRAEDQLALLSFDARAETLIRLDSSSGIDFSPHRVQVEKALASIEPSWKGTDLGEALRGALDVFQSTDSSGSVGSGAGKRIILISDLQTGSRLDSLENLRWPEDVGLVIRALPCDQPSNAGLKRLVAESDEHDAKLLRIRVSNDVRSSSEQFELAWRLADGQLDGRTQHAVHVPAGQQRVVRIKQHPTARELVLTGDDHSFDNQLYVPRPAKGAKTLMYLGLESDDSDSLFYFLKRAPLDTPRYHVVVESKWPPALLDGLNPSRAPLVITAQPLADHDLAPMVHYVESGGRLLLVLDGKHAAEPPMEKAVAGLLGITTVNIEEAKVDDYAMFGRISFRHPLFQSFADRRFNDFTKIRVWRHRRMSSDHEQPWDVLMRFDDRAPALVERHVGDGQIWVLTTGWQPSESQLALSTKFVPILASMFDENQDILYTPSDYVIGLSIELPEIHERAVVRRPDGQSVRLESAPYRFEATDLPGIYTVNHDGRPDEFAVNVEANESKTAPMDLVELEQRGVRLVEYRDRQEMKRRDRQLKDFELESRQQLWRWLIVAVLCLLVVETTLAGRLTRNVNVVGNGDQ